MPIACAPTVGRVASNVCIAACFFPRVPSRARARRSSSFSLPPSTQRPGMRQSSRKTSAVCEARRPCFLTFVPIDQPRRARRDDEAGLAARAELGLDGRDDHVHVRDPAVGGPGLLAVEHPLVGRLVVARPRAQRRHVRAGVGLGDAERADLRLVDGAVALRHPLAELLGRAGGEDPGDGERRAHDRHPDPGVAPEQLLVDDRQQQAGLVGVELRQRLEAVEADLGRLLDQRPGRLLALVPLRGGGPDDLLGESVDPVAHVALVLAELHRERAGGERFGNGLHRMTIGTIDDLRPCRGSVRPHALPPLRPQRHQAARRSASGCGTASATTRRSRTSARSSAAPSISASPTSTWPTTTARRTARPRSTSAGSCARTCAPWRDELIISTKAGYDMWPGPYGEWGSRKYLLASLDQSLERMGLEYVDIFYSHRFDPDTPLEETIGALDTAVRSGRALYAGISSYSAERTAEAAQIANALGTRLLIHQPSYSLLNRWIEPERRSTPARPTGSGSSRSRRSARACSPTATSAGSRRTRARRRTSTSRRTSSTRRTWRACAR